MTATRDDVIPVHFRGRLLFWLKDKDGSGALAPREHLDSEGNALFGALGSDSYAHVFPGGRILRYGVQIGTVDDLEFVPAPEDMHL